MKRSLKVFNNAKYECPKCGGRKFKTVMKGSSWQCRNLVKSKDNKRMNIRCGQIVVKDKNSFARKIAGE